MSIIIVDTKDIAVNRLDKTLMELKSPKANDIRPVYWKKTYNDEDILLFGVKQALSHGI